MSSTNATYVEHNMDGLKGSCGSLPSLINLITVAPNQTTNVTGHKYNQSTVG